MPRFRQQVTSERPRKVVVSWGRSRGLFGAEALAASCPPANIRLRAPRGIVPQSNPDLSRVCPQYHAGTPGVTIVATNRQAALAPQ